MKLKHIESKYELVVGEHKEDGLLGPIITFFKSMIGINTESEIYMLDKDDAGTLIPTGVMISKLTHIDCSNANNPIFIRTIAACSNTLKECGFSPSIINNINPARTVALFRLFFKFKNTNFITDINQLPILDEDLLTLSKEITSSSKLTRKDLLVALFNNLLTFKDYLVNQSNHQIELIKLLIKGKKEDPALIKLLLKNHPDPSVFAKAKATLRHILVDFTNYNVALINKVQTEYKAIAESANPVTREAEKKRINNEENKDVKQAFEKIEEQCNNIKAFDRELELIRNVIENKTDVSYGIPVSSEGLDQKIHREMITLKDRLDNFYKRYKTD